MKLSLAFILCIPAALIGGPIYDVTDLGTLGGSTTAGHRINDLGQTVGSGTDLWGNLKALSGENSLGTLANNATAWDVNNSGTVAGIQYINGQAYAVTWDESGEHILAGAGSAALGINDLGQVTGMSGNGRAFLTTVGGGLLDIGLMGGGDWAAGRAVNESGQVAGYGTKNGMLKGFRWTEGGGFSTLGTLGGKNSYGMDINEAGVVAGHAQLASGYLHASIWTGLQAGDLGTLGGRNSYAYGINNDGAVVGYSQVANGVAHAFLYMDGVLYDLNDLLGDTVGWELTYAYGINDQGQIVGEGKYGGQTHAFRLDLQQALFSLNGLNDGGSDGCDTCEGPVVNSLGAAAVPEPSSWALGLVGLALGVGRRAWRRRN